jgi:hypothetical protein
MRKQATYWTKKIPAVLAEDLKRTKRPERIQRIRKNEDKEIAHLGSIRATFKDQLLGDVYNMQPSHDDEGINEQLSGYKWIDGSDILHGFSNFKDGNNILKRNSPYNRLPSAAQADVRPKVWELSQMSTGMYLRFTTNASDIAINHTLAFNSQNLWHMPKTGTDGLDIYAWSDVDQSWRHVPVTTGIELDAADGATMSGVFHMPETANKSSIITHWTYLIYLPLRNAPKDLKVGVPSDSYLCKTSKCINDVAPKFNSKYKPIVWYGTSIQQGGVASRAGNEYDAIISRALSVDIHNFGFAGNGIMELSVAKYLSMVDAEIIVIDCLPNMNALKVESNTIPLIQYLRNSSNHKNTPIILAEGTPYPAEWLNGPPFADASKNKALRDAFNTLIANGVKNLHYVEGKNLFKNPFVNPTVGGVHSSDLGQYEIADYYVGYFPTILNK